SPSVRASRSPQCSSRCAGSGDRADRYFPASIVLYAPLWVLERAVSVYWAFYWRARYGGYPFGSALLSKGTGRAWVAGGRAESRAAASRAGAR
ncbi:MAG: hypothetical protein LC795_03590, partial [Acidobacteria bacterium]|nr:hypothetical protein [Acidobacteriota bacterium]